MITKAEIWRGCIQYIVWRVIPYATLCYPHDGVLWFFFVQGGPHNHTIGGLAVCLKLAAAPEFKVYQQQVWKNKCKPSDYYPLFTRFLVASSHLMYDEVVSQNILVFFLLSLLFVSCVLQQVHCNVCVCEQLWDILIWIFHAGDKKLSCVGRQVDGVGVQARFRRNR